MPDSEETTDQKGFNPWRKIFPTFVEFYSWPMHVTKAGKDDPNMTTNSCLKFPLRWRNDIYNRDGWRTCDRHWQCRKGAVLNPRGPYTAHDFWNHGKQHQNMSSSSETLKSCHVSQESGLAMLTASAENDQTQSSSRRWKFKCSPWQPLKLSDLSCMSPE